MSRLMLCRLVMGKSIARANQAASLVQYHGYVEPTNYWNQRISVRDFSSIQRPIKSSKVSAARMFSRGNEQAGEQPMSIVEVLDREIQDESAELNKQLSSDQFPGFSVETDGADVALTRQIGDKTVSVRFTVSSSLNEWPAEDQPKSSPGQDIEPMLNTTLLSMPEFQVQISQDNHTLEISCYFEDMEEDPETGAAYPSDPVFGIDELVMYEGEPSETEFAVNARYFDDDLTGALMQYLAEKGIDDEFAKNLVAFATSYEKKHYVGLMKRLKNFVSK